MPKKRILWVGECSLLSTGFSTYSLEILSRLQATDKYDIAELGCYNDPRDIRTGNLPWKFYGNAPVNKQEEAVYNANVLNQWGLWKLDDVCIDHRCDICVDIRDMHMCDYEERSPARSYFHWCIMPTVDSEPQTESWIATILGADSVFTYSDYGAEVLRRQACNRVKWIATAPPGANLKAYAVPASKADAKRACGLPPDCNIIGTIMRNQTRKLYSDLIESFAMFLKQAPEHVAKKTFLYLHCAYPDVGWDIPRILKEYGVSHRTLFTYFCKKCKMTYPSLFQEGITTCKFCDSFTAALPNVQYGVTTETLGKIISVFDIYVQYAVCEGFGLPQVEAAACGVPIMSVDYSAMADIVRKLKGFPLKVQRMFREVEGHSYRALPDNQDLVTQLIKFLQMPDAMRAKYGRMVRAGVEKHYTWEKTAKLWEEHLDSIVVKDEGRWKSPAKLHAPPHPTQLPNLSSLSNLDFVRWGIVNIAGRPDLINHYGVNKIVRDLNAGMTLEGMPVLATEDYLSSRSVPKHIPFTRDIVLGHLYYIAEHTNNFEKRRAARWAS